MLYTKIINVKVDMNLILVIRFLDAGIQDVSMSISIVHDLIEISADDDDEGDESNKHI